MPNLTPEQKQSREQRIAAIVDEFFYASFAAHAEGHIDLLFSIAFRDGIDTMSELTKETREDMLFHLKTLKEMLIDLAEIQEKEINEALGQAFQNRAEWVEQFEQPA